VRHFDRWAVAIAMSILKHNGFMRRHSDAVWYDTVGVLAEHDLSTTRHFETGISDRLIQSTLPYRFIDNITPLREIPFVMACTLLSTNYLKSVLPSKVKPMMVNFAILPPM